MKGENAIITKKIPYKNKGTWDFNFNLLSQDIVLQLDNDFINKLASLRGKYKKEEILEHIVIKDFTKAIDGILSKLWITDISKKKTVTKTKLKNLSWEFKIDLLNIILQESGYTAKDMTDFIKEP
nr:hypothetical protein [Methanobrevibacter arboriphilus]